MSLVAVGAAGDPFLTPVLLNQGGVQYFDQISRDAILLALAVMRAVGAREDDAKSLSFVAQVSIPQATDVSARDTAVGLVAQGYTILAQQKFQPFMSQTIKATKDMSQLVSLTKTEGASYAVLLAPGMGTSMTLPLPTTGTAPAGANPVTDPIVKAQEQAAKTKTIFIVAGAALGIFLLVQHFGKNRVASK
jgi:hypothetical protein